MNPRSSAASELPLELAFRVDQACRRFEAAWQAADRPPDLPAYLEAFDEPARRILSRELLQIDVHHRRRIGQTPRPADYPSFAHDAIGTVLDEILDAVPAGVAPHTPGAGPAPERPGDDDDGHPTLIRGYEILSLLGRGGMGVVYKARHLALKRIVALKMIQTGRLASQAELDRFRREAEAVAQLGHPNIVQIHEAGEHDGRPYLALEYVEGGNLHERTAGAPVSAECAARLVETLARAVHHAHLRGIIHRDLKPANVLLARADGSAARGKTLRLAEPEPSFRAEHFVPKIADFGLAKRADPDGASPTRTTDLLGTPNYMAPEQAERAHGATGPTTDVYGLGTILYELITGRPPFATESPWLTLDLVRSAEPVAPGRLQPRCPRDLETICLKCLQKPQARRYPTALALAEDLGRFLTGEPIRARPVGVAEQARKWVRRNPTVAALLTSIALLACLSLAVVMAFAIRAERRGIEARRAGAEAAAARDAARASLYFQQVARAFLEWQASDEEQADELLRVTSAHPERGWEWGYVQGLCHGDLLTLGGHGDEVSAVVYSPDGRRIATATGAFYGTRPGTIRLWDAQTGALLKNFGGTVAPIRSLAFHPDGRRLAAASVKFGGRDPGGVTIWEASTGKPLGPLAGRNRDAFRVAFSPDGRLLATGGSDGRVTLWDAETLHELGPASRHAAGAGVYGLAFSPDGRWLASGAWDGSLRIWDVREKKETHCLRGLPDLRCVAYSPDGRHVAASSFTGDVGVWESATGKRVAVHTAHASPALSVAFCPDGRSIASSDWSGKVLLSDAFKPGRARVLRGHTGGVRSVAFHPDGARLATGGIDGTAKVWDAWRGQEFRTLLAANPPPIASVAYSPDGRSLAAAGPWAPNSSAANREVKIWVVAGGSIRRVLRGHRQGVTSVAYSPDGTRLVTSSVDGTLRLWDAATGAALGEPLSGHGRTVHGAAYTLAGRAVVSAGADGTVRLWDATTGAPMGTLGSDGGPPLCVASDPAGRLVATAGRDGAVRLWDPLRRRALATLPGHDAPVNCLAFSPDGARLASGGADRRVILWDLSTRRMLFRRSGHGRAVKAVAFSPDGRRVASGGADWSVKLWAVPTGEEAFSLHSYAGEVSCLAFRPDGRELAAGGQDGGRIKVWNVELPRASRLAAADETALAWHRESAAESERAGQWSSALHHLDRLLAAGPGGRALLARRGRANAGAGRWERAADDFAAAERAGSPTMDLVYVQALLRLGRGDDDGYRELCLKALAEFGDARDAGTANLLAWTGCLAPKSPIDPARLVALAGRAVAAVPRGANELNTLGAALLRAGRYKEAVETLERTLQARGGAGDVEDWLLLALAHAHLGDNEATRRWFDKATHVLDKAADQGESEPTPAPAWDVRLSVRLLRDEAGALLNGQPESKRSSDPPAPQPSPTR